MVPAPDEPRDRYDRPDDLRQRRTARHQLAGDRLLPRFRARQLCVHRRGLPPRCANVLPAVSRLRQPIRPAAPAERFWPDGLRAYFLSERTGLGDAVDLVCPALVSRAELTLAA